MNFEKISFSHAEIIVTFFVLPYIMWVVDFRRKLPSMARNGHYS